MRVAMPILEFHPIVGGAQRQLASLGPLLAQRGIEAHVLTRAVPGEPAEEELDAIRVHRLPTGAVSPLAGPRFVMEAGRMIHRLEPDVVHAYSLFSPAWIATRARRSHRIPTIVKVLRGGEMGERERLLKKPLAKYRVSQLRRYIDRFAVISREIDEDLAALGIPKEKRGWLPNGVDVRRFKPVTGDDRQALRAQLGFGDGPVALYCGRLVPEKNLDLLIRAWCDLRRRLPDAELWLVGDGPDHARLREQAGEGVRFAGSQIDVGPWLQAADLFVLPSRMSVGLPVVVTRVGGAEDVVTHEQNGVLIDPGSSEALEVALRECLVDPDRRIRLGQSARKAILDHFSLEETANRWVAEYRSLVEERTGRQP
jgi:glycosyltransferase involved in cell wall biosynthesis